MNNSDNIKCGNTMCTYWNVNFDENCEEKRLPKTCNDLIPAVVEDREELKIATQVKSLNRENLILKGKLAFILITVPGAQEALDKKKAEFEQEIKDKENGN